MVEFLCPYRLLIGSGSIHNLRGVIDDLSCTRPLIITDAGVTAAGLVERLLDALAPLGAIPIFADIVGEPDSGVVAAAAAAITENRADLVLAIGGGSVIDAAKVAAVIARCGGVARDYKVPRRVIERGLPVVAIPTTAGTGSEVTRFTVITDVETGEKMLLGGPGFMPTAAVIDAELTMGLPARLTADTGLDALTHAIEAYVSKRANPFSDGLALLAMKAIGANLRICYHHPTDREAREAMMLAATQAGLAFSNASVALVHGMSRPLGALFHVPHGIANAMLLPAVTEFSLRGAPHRYAECAIAVGAASAASTEDEATNALVRWLRKLNDDLSVPALGAFGIDSRAFHGNLGVMADQAMSSGSPMNNPLIPDLADIDALYRQAWADCWAGSKG
jgi:alcohol dehydrogenase class IV